MSSDDVAYGSPDTRRLILQATWQLVEERGSGVRLGDAARRAGVSRQAVYLHFGDRTGLLVSLVEYIDEVLDSDARIAYVLQAPTGVGALDRLVEALSTFSGLIDPIARVLEAGQYEDEAMAAAWRNRMAGRRTVSRAVVRRIAEEGRLARGWSVEDASALVSTLTMPGTWRELTHEIGWSPETWAANITTLLHRSLLTR